jgi:hypothetical protein
LRNLGYEQSGSGWIPHQIFFNATGWSRKEYFGHDSSDPGRMQKQLSVLRKALGVKIRFDRELGIRLGFAVKVR